MKILALDIGDVRVGTAMYDSRVGISLPHATFERAQGGAEKAVLDLIESQAITDLVVGVPLSDDGSATPQSDRSLQFCRRLERRLPKPVKISFVDEYGTTGEAKQRLHASGRKLRRERNGGMIDAVSASIILQTFLDKDTSTPLPARTDI